MKTNVYKKLIGPAVFASALLLGSKMTSAHEVEAGDTLGEIAKNNDLSLNQVIAMNPQIEDPNLIFIGDTVNTISSKTVTSVSTNIDTNTNEVTSVAVGDKNLLARLVEAEAKGESFKGKVAVAEVVLNRVDSGKFPNSITKVIHQKGQFSPVSNGSINKPASAESVRAVNEALTSNITNGALYFYNPRIATSRWLDSKTTTTTIGNHVFKK